MKSLCFLLLLLVPATAFAQSTYDLSRARAPVTLA
jgi:hypothetical protein